MWPTLIQSLVQNVTNENSTEAVKESTLEAIGYICQDIEQRCLEESSNQILTAIVHGMKREEPSDHVRLAATNALLNSLEFTKANFEKEVNKNKLHLYIDGEFISASLCYTISLLLYYRQNDILSCKLYAKLLKRLNAKLRFQHFNVL